MKVDVSELVTLGDACERLRVSPSYWRVAKLRAPAGLPFPAPIAVIGGADVYLMGDLEAWLAARSRR